MKLLFILLPLPFIMLSCNLKNSKNSQPAIDKQLCNKIFEATSAEFRAYTSAIDSNPNSGIVSNDSIYSSLFKHEPVLLREFDEILSQELFVQIITESCFFNSIYSIHIFSSNQVQEKIDSLKSAFSYISEDNDINYYDHVVLRDLINLEKYTLHNEVESISYFEHPHGLNLYFVLVLDNNRSKVYLINPSSYYYHIWSRKYKMNY